MVCVRAMACRTLVSPKKGEIDLKSRRKVSRETAKEYAHRLGSSVSVTLSRTGEGERRGRDEKKGERKRPETAEHTSERRTGLFLVWSKTTGLNTWWLYHKPFCRYMSEEHKKR